MVFKQLQPSHSNEFLKFKKQIAQETQNTLLYPEAPFLNEKDELERIKQQSENKNIYNLCAFDNDQIVGYLNFRVPMAQHPWVKHVGSFGMMVLKPYWGQGIGTKLLAYMEEQAQKLNVTRIEASVRISNTQALRLYKKNGYTVEGTKQSSAFINDSFQDEYIIAKILNKTPWLPPTIESERLVLRPITFDDAESIFEYTQLTEVSKYTTWFPHKSLKDTEDFILDYVLPNYQKQNIAPLAVTLKEEPQKVIGTVDCGWVSRSRKVMGLAYALHSKHWGQGIITEASQALIDYCFKNTDVARIQAHCHNEHKASRRVMEKVGMQYEGTLKSFIGKKQPTLGYGSFGYYQMKFNIKFLRLKLLCIKHITK